MKKLTFLLLVSFTSVILGVSCTFFNSTAISPTPTPTETPAIPTPQKPVLTSEVGELLDSPESVGEQVEIIGYFHGWDLLDEVGVPPPVTRSDWVIADNSGAIYVTGLIPQNLDPSSIKTVQQVVRLVATIRVKGDQVYLEALSVDLIPEQ